MKCIKCNAELPEGSKFCKYCGAQQPAAQPQPESRAQTMRCCQCGKELPLGSKFCKHCGAMQPVTPPVETPKPPVTPMPPVETPKPPVTPTPPVETPKPPAPPTPPVEPPKPPVTPTPPVEPPKPPVTPTPPVTPPKPPVTPIPPKPPVPPTNTSYSYNPEPPKPDKGKGLLIGCVVAAAVLLIAIIALVIVLLNPGKKEEEGPVGPSDNPSTESTTHVPETPLEEETPVRESEPEQTPEPESESEGEKEPELSPAESMYLEKQANGISGTVDYGTVSFEPNSMEYGQMWDGQRVYDLLNGDLQNDFVLTGSLYSMSENLDMEVEVYYHPETYDVERIVTLQEEGDQAHVYESYFQEGELRAVMDYTTRDYDRYTPNPSGKSYTLEYTADRLVTLFINRETGETESYSCADFETMDDGVQSLYLAREAEYLNRAYVVYAAVTQ